MMAIVVLLFPVVSHPQASSPFPVDVPKSPSTRASDSGIGMPKTKAPSDAAEMSPARTGAATAQQDVTRELREKCEKYFLAYRKVHPACK